MRRALILVVLVLVGLLSVALLQTVFSPENPRAGEETMAFRLADPDRVKALYRQWEANHERNGGDRDVNLRLGFAKGLSVEYTQADAAARLNLVGGTVQVVAEGLADHVADIWLVDNVPGPGRSTRPEPGDSMLFVGTLAPAGGARVSLEAELEPDAFDQFDVDVVVVTRRGEDPVEGAVLFGSPRTFQRLYTQARKAEAAAAAGQQPQPEGRPWLDLLLGSAPALATHTTVVDPDVLIDPLVAEGAQLFINEQFEGNGRTCATCHPAVNSFTIDPEFIATLPNNDALFVAELNPDLATLERPNLMRSRGLILENLDGFDDLANKFTMRGVPHTLGLPTSVTGPVIPFDNTLNPPFGIFPPEERTGWSGDGAPGAGSLRDFATGAVTQHFPRTLNRVPGVDFRLPTDSELDAMEVFQLSLGRASEINISDPLGPDFLSFTDPIVERGREIFNTLDSAGGTVAAGKCALCHNNAGANINEPFFTAIGLPTGGNANFGTGVNDLPNQPSDIIDAANNPRDGGFARVAHDGVNCTVPPGTVRGGFGTVTPPGGALPPGLCEEDFNTPPLVEAADTGPFFHNNAVDTLEGAVSFYNDPAFNDSAGGQLLKVLDSGGIGIALASTEVSAVSNLLRVVNALENIRSSIDLEEAAIHRSRSTAHQLLEVSVEELIDAIEVLECAGLHPDAQKKLTIAAVKNAAAREAFFGFIRDLLIRESIELKEAARDLMVN